MILITGHKGFIGSHLTKKLDNCIGLDLVNGNDIRDRVQLERIFDSYQIDTVIHMAALAGARRGNDYPQEYFDTNVIGTNNIAEMCEKYGVKKLISFSSSSAKSVQNIYGITKHTGELMLKNKKIPQLYVVRPFNVYGENGRPDQVFYKWKNRIKEGLPIEYHGDLQRNYTYVGDFVEHIIDLVNSDLSGFHIMDIGNPKTIGLKTILDEFKTKYPDMKIVEKIVTNDIPVTPDCQLEFKTDFITKLREII